MEVRNDDFWINGVSARSVGITTVNPLNPPPMAARRYSDYKIGSDTDLIEPDTGFDDITYPITCRIIGKPESLDNAALYAYLAGAQTLRLSRLRGYEFRINKIAGIIPSMRSKGNEVIYNITFSLSPWKYVADEPEIALTSAANIQNAGTRYCKPKYTLHLSALTGTGTFTVNGQQVAISIPESMASNVLVVDSENQIAYDGNKVIRTQYTSGIYPFMNIGNNYTTFGGIISSIDVQRHQRCY